MKDSVYSQRKDRKNKGGRYPIEDRDMVRSYKSTVKLSLIEKAEITKRSESVGISFSSYMRKAALGARIYQRFNDEERKWIRDASNWFNNLNQFNRFCHSYGVNTEMLIMLKNELLVLLSKLEK